MGREEVHTRFWLGYLKEHDHLEDSGVNGRIILTRNFKKLNETWTGLIWLRIGPEGEFL
jgi:hypothetical protein